LRPLENIFDPADTPDLLVGLESKDDAAVWRLDDDRSLVITTDFFTPVVDDAYDYGAIAAANSISDVYAMGGQPFLALNIAAFPANLPTQLVSEIIRGGAEKAKEAGVVIAGGHTIQDDEPKYGLVVLGFVDPKGMFKKEGARVGDLLVLTKPLGFGVTTTALKQGKADPEGVDEAVRWMTRLNKLAAELAREFNICGATDVTGFSLLGHSMEMAQASGVKFKFMFEKIPFISCARKYAEKWTFAGGAYDNRSYYQHNITFSPELSELDQLLLFDPQTSGGLLLSVPEEKSDALLQRANELGQPLWLIGEVQEGEGIEVIK
jgi:selenide,water dikinase